MTKYFTNEHFKLLNKWRAQKRDETNPEQNRAYEELRRAYEVTEAWALELQRRLFPEGRIEIRKRPTNQANNFAGYTWAKIYPSQQAPKELAYTVGIAAESGFVVKIDTVGLSNDDPVRGAYLALRGAQYDTSPIVACLPAEKGLAKTLPDLIEWSINAIRGFRLDYDDVVAKLRLGANSTDNDSTPSSPSSKMPPFNRIYYGPPGTGKTYQLTQLLKRDYEQAITTVSAQEWRGQFIAEKMTVLTWWEGTAAALYDLGGKAKVGQLFEHPFIQAIIEAKGRNKNVRQTLWSTLQHHAVEDSKTVKSKQRIAPAVFDKTADSVWMFAGDWQEACADVIELVKRLKAGAESTGSVQRYSFVTFHQSYGYEEFVEGLRPVLMDDDESGEVRYEIRPGAFKELCRRARLSPDQRFAMVIDEINRGNISKIFGELITLIEPDKRDGAQCSVSVTLPYSGESFSVPWNIDIIGTMNTADRSLALLDTALRRRFDFVPVTPDVRNEPDAPLYGLRVTVGEQVIDIPKMLDAINRRIEVLYDRDHCIGHAYFTALKDTPDGAERFLALGQIFRNRILPLLEEYFFEDWQKIQLVLGDNQKTDSSRFIIETSGREEGLNQLFGVDHGLDGYAAKGCFIVQDAALSNADAYIRIYETLAL